MEESAKKYIKAASNEARSLMESFGDPSHDYAHVERVVGMAKRLAYEEHISDPQMLLIIELSAILHDVGDRKYTTANEEEQETVVSKLLKGAGCPDEIVDSVVEVVSNVSFSKELAGTKCSRKELHIVQDADRLDAIGAIGVARCFVYGGRRGTVFYDPTIPPRVGLSKEQYTNQEQTCILNHFDEKLVTLKDRMKTDAGKKIAEERHNFLIQFQEQFVKEFRQSNEYNAK